MAFMHEFPHTGNFDSDLREIIELYLTVRDLPKTWETYKEMLDTEFAELKAFVNGYFDNLDVQNEINNKIDSMVKDGTMENIINHIFNEYNQELTILKTRMDNFTKLEDGSTTGDAELADIRVDFEGNLHATAGESVRAQVSNIYGAIYGIDKLIDVGITYKQAVIKPELNILLSDEVNNTYCWECEYGNVFLLTITGGTGSGFIRIGTNNVGLVEDNYVSQKDVTLVSSEGDVYLYEYTHTTNDKYVCVYIGKAEMTVKKHIKQNGLINDLTNTPDFSLIYERNRNCAAWYENDNYTRKNLNTDVLKESCLATKKLASSQTTKPVEVHGRLHVEGNKLKGANSGANVSLRGVSLYNFARGLQMYTELGLETCYKYGANVIRIPAHLADAKSGDKTLFGYFDTKEFWMKQTKRIIDDCIDLGLYCIVDWHNAHETGNPMDTLDEATEYFKSIAQYYGDSPNIIYEIVNEPNGENGTWDNITTYANTIIPIIRKYAPNSIIIVGTPEFSHDIASAFSRPLSHNNIMYTYHYYAVSTQYGYRDEMLNYVTEHNFPIFVTECGATDNIASIGYDTTMYNAFLSELNTNEISWCAWGLWQGTAEKPLNFFLNHTEDKLLYGGWGMEDFNEYGKVVFENF